MVSAPSSLSASHQIKTTKSLAPASGSTMTRIHARDEEETDSPLCCRITVPYLSARLVEALAKVAFQMQLLLSLTHGMTLSLGILMKITLLYSPAGKDSFARNIQTIWGYVSMYQTSQTARYTGFAWTMIQCFMPISCPMSLFKQGPI